MKLRDVDVEFSLPALAVGKPDEERITDLLLRLEFHQILKELSLARVGRAEAGTYSLVGRRARRARAQPLSIEGLRLRRRDDLPRSDERGARRNIVLRRGGRRLLRAVAAAAGGGEGLFAAAGRPRRIAPIASRDARAGSRRRTIAKIGHNIKFDCLVLEAHGFAVGGVTFDTMIASYCLDPERRSHSLDNLALEFSRHRKIAYAELFPAGDRKKDIRTVPARTALRVFLRGCRLHDAAQDNLRASLEELGFEALFREIEMPLCLVLKRMEQEGVAIDAAQLASLSVTVTSDLDRLTEEIHTLAGEDFNINSAGSSSGSSSRSSGSSGRGRRRRDSRPTRRCSPSSRAATRSRHAFSSTASCPR